jgi:hypothetical protein
MAKTKQEIAEEKANREDAKRDMKMWMANDWDLKEETPEYFIMKKNTATTSGHIWVALFTIWWTLGIGNLIYWLANKKTKKIMK